VWAVFDGQGESGEHGLFPLILDPPVLLVARDLDRIKEGAGQRYPVSEG
jgi:hypothetical protein